MCVVWLLLWWAGVGAQHPNIKRGSGGRQPLERELLGAAAPQDRRKVWGWAAAPQGSPPVQPMLGLYHGANVHHLAQDKLPKALRIKSGE